MGPVAGLPVAGVATAAVFSLVDPSDLRLFGRPVEASREAVYTIGFLLAAAVLAVERPDLYTMPVRLGDTDELE